MIDITYVGLCKLFYQKYAKFCVISYPDVIYKLFERLTSQISFYLNYEILFRQNGRLGEYFLGDYETAKYNR